MLRDVLTTQDSKEKLAHIAREYGVALIVLYGSVARGTNTALSDIDIGILGVDPLSYEEAAIIGEKIAHAVGLSAIEAHSLHHAAPLFLSEVMRDGIILFADSPTRAQAFGLYAWKLATETKPLRDARYEQIRTRIAAYV